MCSCKIKFMVKQIVMASAEIMGASFQKLLKLLGLPREPFFINFSSICVSLLSVGTSIVLLHFPFYTLRFIYFCTFCLN